MGAESQGSDDTARVADIPTQQVLSFVTHDIYGPASMLRTYLQAVSESTDDPDARAMIVDAERLCAQVEGMLRFLRILLSLDAGSLEIDPQPLVVSTFLGEWLAASPAVTRDDSVALDETATILADEALLSLALEGIAWQMGRMGSRQGTVGLGVVGVDDHQVQIAIWRTDDALDGDVLRRAVAVADDDWLGFLRRLPACGFPLRVGLRLTEAMEGKVSVRLEGPKLVLSFSLRDPAAPA